MSKRGGFAARDSSAVRARASAAARAAPLRRVGPASAEDERTRTSALAAADFPIRIGDPLVVVVLVIRGSVVAAREAGPVAVAQRHLHPGVRPNEADEGLQMLAL